MIYICKYLIDVNTWYINDDISLHPIVFADRESLFIVKVTISLLNSEIIVHFLPIMQKQYDHKINKLFKDCLFLQSRSVAAHSFQINVAFMYFLDAYNPPYFHSLTVSVTSDLQHGTHHHSHCFIYRYET